MYVKKNHVLILLSFDLESDSVNRMVSRMQVCVSNNRLSRPPAIYNVINRSGSTF